MIDTVFVFGAGASAEYGGPLVSRFLDKSEEVIYSEGAQEWRDALGHVLEARSRLRAAQANTAIDLDNIEELLTTFEMAAFLDKPILDGLAPSDLVDDARNAIAKTVELSVRLPHKGGSLVSEQMPSSKPNPYFELVGYLRDTKRIGSTGFITFNYDVGLDVALLNQNCDVRYFKGQDKLGSGLPGVPLVKMHGSTHWFSCPCGRPRINHPAAFRRLNVWAQDALDLPADSDGLRTGKGFWLNDQDHPKCAPSVTPHFIVAPSWYKKPENGFTLETWRWAGELLRSAREIYMVGYSWPESDHFFRQLLAIGTWEGEYIHRFRVVRPVPPGEEAAVEGHYRRLLGPATQSRFSLVKTGFSNAVTSRGLFL